LFPEEHILKSGTLHKRKYPVPFNIPIPLPSLKVTIRTFILTDLGRFLWINDETGRQMGELTLKPINSLMYPNVERDPEFESDDALGGITFLGKSDKEFQILTSQKTYYLMDPDGHAHEWVQLLQAIKYQ
jgi:hypothetical protein